MGGWPGFPLDLSSRPFPRIDFLFCLFVSDQASPPNLSPRPLFAHFLKSTFKGSLSFCGWGRVVTTLTGCSHHFQNQAMLRTQNFPKGKLSGWHPPTNAKVKTNKMKERAYLLRIMIMMITIMMRTRLWFKRSESELLPNTNPAGHFRWRPNVVWCSSGMQGLLCACHAILKYKNRCVLVHYMS